MAFRPSVLAEPGKDIISTFARSFEGARQLVRQTQFDRRALALQDQEIRLRAQDIEDRDFAAEQVRNRPGTFEPGTFPSSRDDELAAAFTPPGQDRERVGAGQFPGADPGGRTDPGFAIDPATFFGPQGDPSVALPSADLPDDGGPPPASIAAPPELLESFRETGARAAPSLRIFDEPDELGAGGVGVIEAEPTPDFLRPPVQGFFGEPSDAVTERGGRRFSQQLADQIALDSLEAETRRRAAVTESLPSTQRDIAEQEREVDVEEAEVAQEGADRAGQAAAAREIHGDRIPEGATDEQAIAMGKTLDDIALRATPTGASVTAAQNRIDRGRATVLSVFNRNVAAARSAAGRREMTPGEMLADFKFQRGEEGGVQFDPEADIDLAAEMEASITSALVAGTISPEQAADMSANAAELLTAAGVSSLGAGGGGPLDPETVAFWLEDATGSIEERVAQWTEDGLTPEAIAQLRAAAGG